VVGLALDSGPHPPKATDLGRIVDSPPVSGSGGAAGLVCDIQLRLCS
jgi:hypothetical protein